MDINQRVNGAHLDSLLSGVPLPATKEELIAYARRQEGGEEAVERLRALPDREFRTLDEAIEELEPRAPRAWREPAPVELPEEESDLPPGGGAYVGERVEPANVLAARDS